MENQAGRIVVGYDGSECAGAALDWAAAEAGRRGCPLTVLHILDFQRMAPGSVSPWPALSPALIGRVAAEGAHRAEKHAEATEISPVAELGPVTRTLIEASRTADLVVIGTHDHGELAGAMIGSTAVAASSHAHCPVVVVRGDSSLLPGPHRPVVVGIDDSPAAATALDYAADVAADHAARLIVVSAYQPALLQVWTGVVQNVVDTAEDPGYDIDARAATEKVIDAATAAARQRHPELEVDSRLLQGPTAGVIAGTTYQAGLVVVGSRGRGGFTGLLLGSVSHRLLHSALCPVAVVRP